MSVRQIWLYRILSRVALFWKKETLDATQRLLNCDISEAVGGLFEYAQIHLIILSGTMALKWLWGLGNCHRSPQGKGTLVPLLWVMPKQTQSVYSGLCLLFSGHRTKKTMLVSMAQGMGYRILWQHLRLLSPPPSEGPICHFCLQPLPASLTSNFLSADQEAASAMTYCWPGSCSVKCLTAGYSSNASSWHWDPASTGTDFSAGAVGWLLASEYLMWWQLLEQCVSSQRCPGIGSGPQSCTSSCWILTYI